MVISFRNAGFSYDESRIQRAATVIHEATQDDKDGPLDVTGFQQKVLERNQQQNGVDCGVCILQAAEFFTGLREMPVQPGGMEVRERYAKWLMHLIKVCS